MADKIVSHLSGNNIKFKRQNSFIVFDVCYRKKKIKIYYSEKNEKFYINNSNYVGQPHIIKHWNPKNDKNKYGLCLTMDGSDRRTNALNAAGMIQRVKEIVFELWEDPIGERFRELNVLLQTKENFSIFFDYDGKVKESKTLRQYENVIGYIDIEFTGQNKEQIAKHEKITNSPYKWNLVSLKYKNEVKRIMLYIAENIVFHKINDFSKESFWSRTGVVNKQKNITIIGLGSIGGLVLDSLCRSGYNNISFFDRDKMDVVNNPRHVLGIYAQQIGSTKAQHLIRHYINIFPMIRLNGNEKEFEYRHEIIEDGAIIFDTTGGSHQNMLLNFLKLISKNKDKKFTYINIFVEPFGLGVHCIVLNYSRDKFENNIINNFDKNERYIVTNQKDFRKNFDGCFTPTLPYGFAPLQISIPIFISMMKNNDFIDNHYTIPFLQIIPYKREYINKELSKNINPYKIGVKIWKK